MRYPLLNRHLNSQAFRSISPCSPSIRFASKRSASCVSATRTNLSTCLVIYLNPSIYLSIYLSLYVALSISLSLSDSLSLSRSLSLQLSHSSSPCLSLCLSPHRALPFLLQLHLLFCLVFLFLLDNIFLLRCLLFLFLFIHRLFLGRTVGGPFVRGSGTHRARTGGMWRRCWGAPGLMSGMCQRVVVAFVLP